MIPKSFKYPLTLLVPILAVIALSAISYFRLFDNYELGSLDLRFVLRHPKIHATDKIVFIEIGEDTVNKLGRFPFDRNYHAILIKALAESKIRMVLFDFLFSEPHEHDRELQFAMRQAGNVYLPYAFDIDKARAGKILSGRGYIAECLDDLSGEAGGTGHINIVPDPDGKFRRIPVFIDYKDTHYPHISLVMGCDYLGLPLKNIKFVPGKYAGFVNDEKIPLDDNSDMIVNFSGKWGESYKHYSYVDILQSYLAEISGNKPILDLAELKDKICIVGLTAAGAGDVHPNPFESIYPGMGVHAEVINSIINKRFIARASRAVNLAILLVIAFVASIVTLKTKPVRGLFALLLEIFLFFSAAVFLFDFFGIWIDMVYPILATAFLYMTFILYKYVSEWKRRLVFENELGIAKKIQESFLPSKVPEIEGLDIACAMATARQVGGDLYDFVDFGAKKLGVMIGDVSGKGVPASLFMAMTAGAFRSFTKLHPQPKDVLSNLNLKLAGESSSNLFVTIFYAIFDMQERSLLYANGGHLPLLYLSRAGDVKFLDAADGAPLGLMEGPYSGNRINFNEGGVFVFYTDGITEAMNSKSELYGKERLESIVKSKKEFSSTIILNAIIKDVRNFEPKSKQHDDITLIVVRV